MSVVHLLRKFLCMIMHLMKFIPVALYPAMPLIVNEIPLEAFPDSKKARSYSLA